ncbi:formate hydrogenlyase subunit 1 [Thermoplasma volcanium GSS1]|uniref:Formate hydrogenlyase subunit 1 n=1 Tax=Thermoplasma volcanium (strain ATCC 51530 / DSM 4299 / JCM 9571 / NBRC 15438 / GSS1) TaxID=273116 RepID=Q978D4_THEVO|nr:proton-conducting transporter membrane subunit [Thermoplasma volcanium]BAB60625.1 formate hydrogenlyase subunit 1 [Thermoplasma volcanium GSS1]
MLPYIGPVLFGVASLLGLFNRKISYLMLSLSSVVFAATQFAYGNYLSYYSVIAAIVWVFAGVYSLSYGERYGKWLASLMSLTVLGMSIILVGDNYLVLIAGWEIMSVPSYAIVALNKSQKSPAFTFMTFSEFSTVLIIAGSISSFVASKDSSFSFIHLTTFAPLLLISFGSLIKMGMSPFMISEWLPIAHGNAPANASAVFSATMTLMGVFLITKMIFLTSDSPALLYIGILLLIIGSISILFASIYAYVSENMKMLGGFSTIENQAAILSAFGLYLVTSNSTLREFVLATIIIFSLSHAVSKTGLFLSIGSTRGEYFGEARAPEDRWMRLGTLLSTLSLSGLFPAIGGLAVWMLLESFFMQAYLGGYIGILAIIVGSIVAISEGMVTGSMMKILSFSALFRAKKGHASRVETVTVFSVGLTILIFFVISIKLIPSAFLGGIPSVLVFKGFTIESRFNIADFGLVSPDYVIALITAFSLASYAVFRKPRTRTAEVWNSGRSLSSEYTSFAYANNIRLMLRRILRTRMGNGNQPISIIDVFWFAMNSIGRGYRWMCKNATQKFMNSSLAWYMIYMIVAFMVVIIMAVVIY